MESKILVELGVILYNKQKHEKRIVRRRKEKERKKAVRKNEECINESRRRVNARKIFNECKGERMRKRVHNTYSHEEAGTCGSMLVTIRNNNTHTSQVCRTINLR